MFRYDEHLTLLLVELLYCLLQIISSQVATEIQGMPAVTIATSTMAQSHPSVDTFILLKVMQPTDVKLPTH